MKNEIISMIYEAEKANDNGALASDIECEESENYGNMIDMLQEKLNGIKPVIDIEQTIWELIRKYEKRAYIEGFKKGFKMAGEVK